MGSKSFTDLRVYQAALEATGAIYDATNGFPPHELYGLVAQMRRAVVSIGSNIAEGFGRRAPKDKAHFYTIAFGSTEEVKHLLRVSHRVKYLARVEPHLQLMDSISRMLRRLIECVLGDATTS